MPIQALIVIWRKCDYCNGNIFTYHEADEEENGEDNTNVTNGVKIAQRPWNGDDKWNVSNERSEMC